MRRGVFGRYLPAAVLILAALAAWMAGLHDYLSITGICRQLDGLQQLVATQAVLSAAGYMALYALAVALSLPVATALSVTGGLLFGTFAGTVLVVLGATAGAFLVFLAARAAWGASLARKAEPYLGKLEQGFNRNAFSWLLFLRLVPLFPFFVINLAAAVLGVKPSVYVLATFLGIIPGAFVLVLFGASLGAAASDCDNLSLRNVISGEILLALSLLGLLALAPALYRRWKARSGGRHLP